MADGQVLIDSKIDSSGVDKGTRKIEKEFEDLAKVARKTAEKMEKELRDIELGNVADGMSDSFDEESDRIKEILADTSADARTKAARIAAVYREAGDDQSDAMRKAWAIVKRESSVGSRAVVEDLDDISDKARSSSDEIMSMSKSLSSINFMATVEAIAEVAERVYEIGKTVIEATADVRAENAQFTQTFKELEDQATESLTEIAESTGITATRMKKSYTGIYAFTKSVGADSAQAMEIADRAMLVAADSAAYYDRTLEDTTETLQSFLKGNYENDAALGIAATETTRNAIANELYAKSFDKLTESQKVDVLLAMVEAGNEASGAMGQAAREADSWTNVTGELQEAWRQLLAVVGAPVLDFVTPIVQDVTTALYDLKDMVSDFDISDIFGDVDFGPISESLSGLSESASELSTTIGEGLSWAWENVLQPLGEWSIEEGLPAVVEALASAFDLLRAAAEYLAPLALTLWNEFLQPIASWTADAAIVALEGLSTGMDNLATAADTSSKTAAESIIDNFNTAAQTTDSGFIVPTHQEMQALYEDIGAGFAGASDDIINNFNQAARTTDTGFVIPTRQEMEALGQLISDIFSSAKESITKAFEKMGEWFDTNVVTPIKNSFSELALKAETTWNNIKDWATTTWDEIVSAVDKAIQDIQGFIDSLTGKDIKIGVTGGFVGKSANPNLSSASPTAYTPSAYTITPQIPYLATGAVIPPNAPFMAVLGDQRNGTNIEAPLATIKQALREEMDESGWDVDVNLNISGDLAGLVRYLYPAIEVERKRKGPSLATRSTYDTTVFD